MCVEENINFESQSEEENPLKIDLNIRLPYINNFSLSYLEKLLSA